MATGLEGAVGSERGDEPERCRPRVVTAGRGYGEKTRLSGKDLCLARVVGRLCRISSGYRDGSAMRPRRVGARHQMQLRNSHYLRRS
jgi:hypothetical protein